MIQNRVNSQRARDANPHLWVRLRTMARNVSDLAGLQGQLLQIDLKRFRRGTTTALAWAVLGMACLWGGLPLLVYVLSLFVQAWLKLAPIYAMLATAGGSTVLGVLLISFALNRFERSFSSFDRSRDELVRNFEWVRDELHEADRTLDDQT